MSRVEHDAMKEFVLLLSFASHYEEFPSRAQLYDESLDIRRKYRMYNRALD